MYGARDQAHNQAVLLREHLYCPGRYSPTARRMARTTAVVSVAGTRSPKGPRTKKSLSIVVNSSQKRTQSRRSPPTPAAIVTRVGPDRPRENTGTTITSSRRWFRMSSDTMRAGRGWCGSSGWPGVRTNHSSPRRGCRLSGLTSTLVEIPRGCGTAGLPPCCSFFLGNLWCLLVLRDHRFILPGAIPVFQRPLHDFAAIEVRLALDVRIHRAQQ